MHMKLGELLDCAKPLIFEDGWDGYEYSGGGTFFLAKYKGRFYGITARHCLRDRDKNAIRLMFDESAQSAEPFMPLRCVHELNDPKTGLENYTDVALMEIDESELTENQRLSTRFLDFDDLAPRHAIIDGGEKLVIRGFPNCLGGIDYDAQKIRIQSFMFDGTYGGRSGTPQVETLIFEELPNDISSLAGLSGSPLFLLRQDERGLHYLFAGMVIERIIDSRTIRFIRCGVIFAALNKLHV
jgi:hypothetical protein